MMNPGIQKSLKPKIADVIGEFLNGDNLLRALEFITYLKDNKMSAQWANTNTWKAMSKGKAVCYIKAGVERKSGTACNIEFVENNDDKKGSWVILPSVAGFDNYVFTDNFGYDEIISEKEKINMVLSKVRLCSDCGNLKKCAPGVNINLWGTELTNRCKFFGIPFLDPNPEELECVKMLINIYRKSIING